MRKKFNWGDVIWGILGFIAIAFVIACFFGILYGIWWVVSVFLEDFTIHLDSRTSVVIRIAAVAVVVAIILIVMYLRNDSSDSGDRSYSGDSGGFYLIQDDYDPVTILLEQLELEGLDFDTIYSICEMLEQEDDDSASRAFEMLKQKGVDDDTARYLLVMMKKQEDYDSDDFSEEAIHLRQLRRQFNEYLLRRMLKLSKHERDRLLHKDDDEQKS